jgi:DNA-directed RNA polymerase specialized sigma24 family protein
MLTRGVKRFWVERTSDAPAPSAGASDGRARHLKWAMGQLAAEHREILLLIHRDRLTYRQAAAALNMPPQVMMLRLIEARQRLRSLLDGVEDSGTR